MAINFNSEPYYDNFDETKRFYRILFKPGYAVQARELTQLQTSLQDQISKFGKHVFTEGSIVLGGERAFEKDLLSIKLDAIFGSNPIDATKFNGVEITGATSGTKAFVKLAQPSTNTDANTLIVKITSGTEFTAGETISCVVNSITYEASIQSTDAFNGAMIFSIESGIFFVKGCFVYLPAQIIAIDKYSNTSSKNIGLVANEFTVSYEDDESLLDNAQGSFNYAAPGADRYSIDLVLTVKDLSTSIDDFIEIARVVDGELVSNVAKTIYSELGKELARRTYDESGNYTVKEWPVQVLDHVDGDSTKFTVALDPGKAYVRGYEFETINQEFITLDRARDVEQADNVDINITYGNFVNVSSVSGVFDTTAFTSVSLKNASTTTIGTANVRFMTYLSGTVGSSAIYKMYLFNIVMNAGSYFKDVRTITATSATATIDALSRVGGTGDAFLSGTDTPGLVFPISNTFIKTIRDSNNVTQSDYGFQRTFTSVGFSAGQATIATNTGLERFVGGSGALSNTVKDQSYHVVVTAVGTSSFSVGQVLRFDTAAGRSITLSTPVAGVSQSATFNVGASVSFTATIIAGINANTQTEKTKSLSGYTKGVITATLNQTLGGKDIIANASGVSGISDVYDILGVYNIGNNDGSAVSVNSSTGAISWGGVTHTDVTANYKLDNGQRAEFYDWANLILTGTAPVTNTDNLLVIYRNFSHTGTGFASVDSYSIPYADIPTFTDQATGKVYNLRDCIDFRPRRADGSSTLNNAQIPSPDSTFNADYQYYLGRMDKIIAMPDKTFQVKKGVPAVYPVVPSDNTDGMTIYVMIIPPYTGKVSEVGIKYIDNKRYTMKDIGKLDKRIQNLEYYTQLSLLEKQAKDTSIPDASNFEKFKNGFAVDPFTSQDVFAAGASAWASRRWSWWTSWFNGSNNWNTYGAMNYNANSIAEPSHIDFNCAIDPIAQEMRAPFTVNFSGFNSPTLSNTAKAGELVTLGYTETSVINQLSATQSLNVNPFNIIKFNGTLILEPSFDQWVDTTYLPAVNSVVDVAIPDAADITKTIGSGSGRIFKTTSTSTVINTNVVGSAVSSLGTTVVDVQYVPYIRSKTVAGIASGLKPLAAVLPFIENTNVSQYCRPLTLVTVQNHTGNLFNTTTGNHESLSFKTGGVSGTTVATGSAAYYSSPTLADSTKRRLAVLQPSGTISVGQTVVGSNGGYATVTAVTTHTLNDALVPDEYGYLAFEIQIPAGVFKTGERTVRLIDDPSNDIQLSSSTSEAKYTANGIIQSKQENILTTRTIQRQKVTTQQGYWYDPLAQTFNIDPRAYPQGMHVSSIDVYFKTKSANVPVKMQIRRTVNGYPESWAAIPFAEVELMPEHVNVSADASVPTTFTFPSPIYLAPADYAITLISQCQDYEVWIAEMGRTEVGGTKLVDKQPYNGSLFKSQNAATWTAVENQDLKFNIKRAVFNSTGTSTFEITDPASVINYQTLYINSSNITPAGTEINWEAAAYTNGAVNNSDFSPIDINQDIDFNGLRRLQAKAGLGFSSFILRATLSTNNDAVSPTVDASALSIVTVKNNINNDATNETNKQGGNAIARYITKPINLASGFDASNLCVTFDANKPAGTSIKVYYKTLPSEKVTPISDEAWVEMVPEVAVPTSANDYDYKEHRFFPSGAFNSYGVPQANPIAARFNTFKVKIVLLSNNEAFSPKVKDLRIIALDS